MRKFLKPKPGKKIPIPGTDRFLPAEGTMGEYTLYMHRRFLAGELEVLDGSKPINFKGPGPVETKVVGPAEAKPETASVRKSGR